MGTKYKHLFDKIVDFNNLFDAYNKTIKGKRYKVQFIKFGQNVFANLMTIQKELIDGTYTPGTPNNFTIYEPKARVISAMPMRDRIVQHAINNIISPIFNKTFYPQSYACRVNKGAHRASVKTQMYIKDNPNGWYLKTDFRKYFYSVDRNILLNEIRKKITDKKVMDLIEKFISPNGVGILIGNLLSQVSANIYGNIIDRWLVHEKKTFSFIRYMDDIVIFGNSKEQLNSLYKDMKVFVANEMKLNFSKWFIRKVDKGVNFCGYRVFKDFKLLRKNSVVRAKRKLKKLNGDSKKLFLASWLGHVKWANSYNLLTKLGVNNA